MQRFADYVPAERDADQWAGDTRQDIAVVEDFPLGEFLVMPDAEAVAYVRKHDAEVQYVAQGDPRHFR